MQTVNVRVVFISFETLRPPSDVDHFLKAWGQKPQAWQKEVNDVLKAAPAQSKPSILPLILGTVY